MRYVFIANPAAGKNLPAEEILSGIRRHCRDSGVEASYLVTERPRHAAELARAEGSRGDPVRIYAIGGDGTLSEVVTGAFGMKNVEIGVFPCGSGDDYVKVFGGKEKFLSVERQLAAESRPMDLIRAGEEYSVNLCSIGLDANVAHGMKHFKEWPLVNGPMAYNLSLLKAFCGRLGTRLDLTIDDTELRSGDYLFALAAVGRYYGGGYCGAPEAIPDDGLLDFVLIRTPKRFQIPGLIGIYKRGGHLRDPGFQDLLEFRRGRKIQIHTPESVPVNLDGEIRIVSDITFEILPGALRFLIPAEK